MNMYLCRYCNIPLFFIIIIHKLVLFCPKTFWLSDIAPSRLHRLCVSDSLSSLGSTSDSQERMAPKDIMTNSHAKSILNAMNSLRKSNTLCDITLRVESTDFPAHRIVLAACSDYFCAMFTSEVTELCRKNAHLFSVSVSDSYSFAALFEYKCYYLCL